MKFINDTPYRFQGGIFNGEVLPSHSKLHYIVMLISDCGRIKINTTTIATINFVYAPIAKKVIIASTTRHVCRVFTVVIIDSILGTIDRKPNGVISDFIVRNKGFGRGGSQIDACGAAI